MAVRRRARREQPAAPCGQREGPRGCRLLREALEAGERRLRPRRLGDVHGRLDEIGGRYELDEGMAGAWSRCRDPLEHGEGVRRPPETEIEPCERPLGERGLVAEPARSGLIQRVGGIRTALVLAPLDRGDERQRCEQMADRVQLTRLGREPKPFGGVGRCGGKASVDGLGPRQVLEHVRQRADTAFLARPRGGARVELELVGLVPEVAGTGSGMHEASRILEPGGELERFAKERHGPRRVAREQAPDTGEDVDAEALICILGPQKAFCSPAHLDDLRGVSGVRCRLSCLDEHLRRFGRSRGRNLGRSGGERDESVRRNAAPELDRAAKVDDVCTHVRIGDEAGRPGEEREGMLGTTGEPGILRSSNEPAAASLIVSRELCRTLEAPRSGGEAAPLPRALCRELQLLGNFLILAEGRGGAMPDTAVRVLLSVEGLRQRPMRLAARPGGRAAVEGGTNQRMTDGDVSVRHLHQALRLGHVESSWLHAEPLGGVDHRRQAAGIVGRDEQQQRLNRRR